MADHHDGADVDSLSLFASEGDADAARVFAAGRSTVVAAGMLSEFAPEVKDRAYTGTRSVVVLVESGSATNDSLSVFAPESVESAEASGRDHPMLDPLRAFVAEAAATSDAPRVNAIPRLTLSGYACTPLVTGVHSPVVSWTMRGAGAFFIGTLVTFGVLQRLEQHGALPPLQQRPIAERAAALPITIPEIKSLTVRVEKRDPVSPLMTEHDRSMAAARSTSPGRLLVDDPSDRATNHAVRTPTASAQPSVTPQRNETIRTLAPSVDQPRNLEAPGEGGRPFNATHRPDAPIPASAVVPVSMTGLPASDESAVRRTVELYAHAYQDLDVHAAASVWPSVNRRTLSRAFAALKSQDLEFDMCDITVDAARATARCRGTLQIVRRVGSPAPVRAEQEWVFRMRRLSGDWKIDDVSSMQMMAVTRGDHGGQ